MLLLNLQELLKMLLTQVESGTGETKLLLQGLLTMLSKVYGVQLVKLNIRLLIIGELKWLNRKLCRRGQSKELLQEKAEEQRQARLNNLAINPLNIYSSRELSKEEKKYNDDMKKYSKYFYKENGQWKMNQEGWKAYNSKKYIPGTVSPSTGIPVTQGQFADSDFKRFIDRLGGRGAVSSDPDQRVNVGRLWGKYADNSPAARTAGYDATRVTEYDYPIASANRVI